MLAVQQRLATMSRVVREFEESSGKAGVVQYMYMYPQLKTGQLKMQILC